MERNAMITSKTALLYGKAATSRIFGVPKTHVLKIQVFEKTVWVHLKGKRPKFVSQKLYKQHFAEWRREQSTQVILVNHNPEQGTWVAQGQQDYLVLVKDNLLICECEDFKNQERFGFRVSACKHLYAALGQLGYSSIRDYHARRSAQPVAA